jgi:hypothetical protein
MIHAIYIYLIIGAFISGFVVADTHKLLAVVIIPTWPIWTAFCIIHNSRQRKRMGL